jgi:ankyrin repeat protein
MSFVFLPTSSALAGNHVDTAKWILEQDLDLLDRVDVQGNTVLHMAAMFGAKDCVKFLHALGVQLEAVDMQGRTPLMLACAAGHVSTVSTLVDKGASLSARDNLGRTAQHYAAQSGSVAVMKLAVHDPNVRDNAGTTVLHVAWLAGKREGIDYLSAMASAQLDAVDQHNASMVHYAAASKEMTVPTFDAHFAASGGALLAPDNQVHVGLSVRARVLF